MLDLRNVSKVYGKGTAQVTALRRVSLKVGNGDFIAVTGPSGSGKSTLLNLIGGLDRISSGEVVLDGERIDTLDEGGFVSIRRKKIAYVFQQYHLVPSLTARENVLLPLMFHGTSRGDEKRADEVLARVGLAKRANHRPSELSGGEQQRVAIARALVNSCSLILADEPTGNLDQTTGREILTLFDQLSADGYTLIMVTHSRDVAAHANREIRLRDGEITDDLVAVRRDGPNRAEAMSH